MFKKKKQNIIRDGSKTFDCKISSIELIYNKKSELFTRPQVVEKSFLDASQIDDFISAISTNNFANQNQLASTPSEIYINGININQISKNYLDAEIKVVGEVVEENESAIVNKLCFEKLDEINLTVAEKINLSEVYKQNPSIVIFNNFETDLSEKEYEKLQQSLINLFCDSIVIFVNVK